jgi:3-dehydroquinate dehydratase I
LTIRLLSHISSPMKTHSIHFPNNKPLVVGSFGDALSLRNASPHSMAKQCDIAEIRLDLLHQEIVTFGSSVWKHLESFPLLFTARCQNEGSPFNLNISERRHLLSLSLESASLIDIEVSSISDYTDLIQTLRSLNIPWIASHHDFQKLPPSSTLIQHAQLAKSAGASAFKCAAHLDGIDDLATLAHFQKTDHGFPIASMGMGALGPVSRLLCAQLGSALNYGYIGDLQTAPGQWSAEQLLQCIGSLKQIP